MAESRPIPVRLDEEMIRRLDALAQAMSTRTGGATISRGNALRAALGLGLPLLEKENGIGSRAAKKAAR
jgi:hypothetical protein